MEQVNVGQMIKSLRLSKGITATFMSKKMGYKAVSSYTRIETGESNITLEQAKKIADLLSININDLFLLKNYAIRIMKLRIVRNS